MFRNIYGNKKTPQLGFLIAVVFSILTMAVYIFVKAFGIGISVSVVDFVEQFAIMVCLCALFVIYKKNEPRVTDGLIGEILGILALQNMTYSIESCIHYFSTANTPILIYFLIAFQWVLTVFCIMICVNHYLINSNKYSKYRRIIYNRLMINFQTLIIFVTAIFLIVTLIVYCSPENILIVVMSLFSMCMSYSFFLAIISMEVLEHKAEIKKAKEERQSLKIKELKNNEKRNRLGKS